MERRVYFFAKVGNLNNIPYGGGEVGNRRTMQMLKELGYDVRLISRYYNYNKKSLWTYLLMILGDIASVFKMCIVLIGKERQNSVVHISGFTGQYMPLEFSAVSLAKLLGFNTTYEIRGGGIEGNYKNGSSLYKWMFRTTVQNADTVFSQGLENKGLINRVCKTRFFHYPNCVNVDFMPASCPCKANDIINIIYVGRLSPQKNIDIVVETVHRMVMSGYNTNIDIIGEGEDCRDYVDKVKKYVTDNKLQDICRFHGKLSKKDMKPFLEKAHFFLFPTEEKREGQSNSLTETMSYGIVPIASSQGYNRSTISNDYLIEDNLTAESYASKIIEIQQSGTFSKLSNGMYNRISNNYTYDRVKQSVKNVYDLIFSRV